MDRERGTARAARCTRNLLILHTREQQALSDWETVKEKIGALAPDIEVRIDSNDSPCPDVERWQVTRPSLVFSPFRLLAYRPLGGTVYAGTLMGKVAEWLHMQDCGLPIPRTARLVPGLRFDPAIWGEYAIVKPVVGLRGIGIRLIRAEEIAGRFAELTDSARRRMLVQQFIDHVDARNRPTSYRVLTMFGEPLYQMEMTWHDPRRPLAEIAADPAGKIATNTEGVAKRRWPREIPEVLALARRVAAAFPAIPCLGQDIVRQAGTGELYILETNPSGSTWHLSSTLHRERRGHSQDYFRALYGQFGALDIVADRLIARTRAEAS